MAADNRETVAEALARSPLADRREVIRDFLSRRYHGVMDPISDGAVDAVLGELKRAEG